MREIISVFFIGLVYGAKVDGSSIIKSCCDIAVKNVSHFSTYNSYSGVYNIIDFCSKGLIIQGYCDAFTDGGGWLVIQRRKLHGNENFHRPWLDYERGFGSLHSEFWYGLRSLHCITIKGTWELRVDFTFTNWTNSYLHYNNFRVGQATDNYRLNISGFTGITPTDPFTAKSNGQMFSTFDKDSDKWSGNCAFNAHGSTAPGGWWYSKCYQVNLNHNYGVNAEFILFDKWYSPPVIEMKIRPTNCGR